MDNPLKKFVETIKTGAPAEVKLAQKEVEKFWSNVYIPHRKRGQQCFKIFLDELKNFEQIKDIDHQAYFINALKWPWWAIGEEYFEDWSEFALRCLSHSAGKIRQAMVKAVDYLIKGITIDLIFPRDEKILKDRKRLRKNRRRFINFVDKIFELMKKYEQPGHKRYKYIGKMPPSVYKSLQIILNETIFPSKNYEDLYYTSESDFEQALENCDRTEGRDWEDFKKEAERAAADPAFQGHLQAAEYFSYHYSINWSAEERRKNETISEREKIFDSNFPIFRKKKLMFLLAHFGTLECYEALKKYNQNPDQELKVWSQMALDECKTFLASDILEEDKIGISSLAGGKNGKPRFYFVLLAKNLTHWLPGEEKIIEGAAGEIVNKTNWEIEDVEIGEYFFIVTALHGPNEAPAELIELIIEKLNEHQDVVHKHYMCVNTQKPTKEEIDNWRTSL